VVGTDYNFQCSLTPKESLYMPICLKIWLFIVLSGDSAAFSSLLAFQWPKTV